MNISKFKYQYYNSRNIKKEGNRYGFLIFSILSILHTILFIIDLHHLKFCLQSLVMLVCI